MAQAGPLGHEGDRYPVPSRLAPPRWLEGLVTLLDDAVRIPGTNIRIGADGLLGFVLPGVGDAAGVVAALSVIWLAVGAGVPRTTLVRMVVNVAIDALFGTIPFVGDLFDVAYKANRKNLSLLEAHRAGTRRDARARDVAFFLLLAVIVVAVATVPLLVILWLVR